jgi:tetratricopeptide (TPR) repeat protein
MKKIIFLFFLLPLGLFAQKNIVQESSSELIEKGIELHDQKKYYEAIQKYKKVSVNDTNYFTAQYEMALTYVEQEEWVFAQKILKNLISLEVPYDSKPQVFKQ